MVGDFSFSDSGAQLALANAVYGGRILLGFRQFPFAFSVMHFI